MSKKLYIGTTQDKVKTCDEGGEIRETGLSPFEFIAKFNSGFPRYTDVYMEGSTENSELLANLGAKLLRDSDAQLYVCAPANVPGRDELKRLWLDHQVNRRRMFYPVGFQDLVNYDLIGGYHATGMTDILARLFDHHPASIARSFLPFGDLESLIKLVCQIGDPRWHVNIVRPNRFNRVFRHLSLTPERFDEDSPAVLSWYDSKTRDTPEAREYHFYWHCQGADRDVFTRTSHMRLLATTKLFVEFICRTWLDELRVARGLRQVFDPEMFFKNDQAVRRYLVVSQ